MATLVPEAREERLLEHAGFAFRVVSYKLGDVFCATAANLDPGAVIARCKAETREAAEAEVIEAARRRLGRTRTFDDL